MPACQPVPVLTAVLVVLAGLALIAVGSSITRRTLRAEYGKADESVLDAAEEAGLLPWWVTAMVLGGWALVIAGIVLAVVTALT